MKGFGFVRVSVAEAANPPTPAGGWSTWKVLDLLGSRLQGQHILQLLQVEGQCGRF